MASETSRTITIFINGKEVENSYKAISSEVSKATAEIKKMTIGTDEYNAKAQEIAQLKAIMSDHNAHIKELQQEWQKASETTPTAIDKIKDSLGNMFAQFTLANLASTAITSMISGIKSFMTESVNAFTKSESAAQKLGFAVKQVGGGNDSDIAMLVSQAENLKGLFSHVEIENAQKNLLDFGLSAKQVYTLVPLLLDTAAQSGRSLDDVTNAVLRGIEGQSKGLKTLGVNFKDTGNQAENLSLIQKELTKFTGSTTDALNTEGGQLQELKTETEEIEEETGKRTIKLAKHWAEFKEGFLITLSNIVEGISNLFGDDGEKTPKIKVFNEKEVYEAQGKSVADAAQKNKLSLIETATRLDDLYLKKWKDAQKKAGNDVFNDNVKRAYQEYLAVDEIKLGLYKPTPTVNPLDKPTKENDNENEKKIKEAEKLAEKRKELIDKNKTEETNLLEYLKKINADILAESLGEDEKEIQALKDKYEEKIKKIKDYQEKNNELILEDQKQLESLKGKENTDDYKTIQAHINSLTELNKDGSKTIIAITDEEGNAVTALTNKQQETKLEKLKTFLGKISEYNGVQIDEELNKLTDKYNKEIKELDDGYKANKEYFDKNTAAYNNYLIAKKNLTDKYEGDVSLHERLKKIQDAAEKELEIVKTGSFNEFKIKHDELNNEITAIQGNNNEELKLKIKLQNELTNLDKTFYLKEIQQVQNVANSILSIWTDLNKSKDLDEEKSTTAYIAELNKQKDALKKQLANKLISQEDYDNKVAVLDAQATSASNKAAYDQAKREAAANIAKIWIEAALGAIKFEVQDGWVLGSIEAAALLLDAGLQTSNINKQLAMMPQAYSGKYPDNFDNNFNNLMSDQWEQIASPRSGVYEGLKRDSLLFDAVNDLDSRITPTDQAYSGKYPVIGASDGKVYNAPIIKDAKTGLLNTPTILAGEQPEIIIDPETTKRLQKNSPETVKTIYKTAGKLRQYAIGNYPNIIKMPSYIAKKPIMPNFEAMEAVSMAYTTYGKNASLYGVNTNSNTSINDNKINELISEIKSMSSETKSLSTHMKDPKNRRAMLVRDELTKYDNEMNILKGLSQI